MIGLRELIAVDRIVEKVGEVGEQFEPVVDEIGINLRARPIIGFPPRAGQAVAMRRAAVGGVNRIKTIFDQTAVDGALRDLIGGIPFRFVGHGGDVETIGLITAAVAKHAIQFAKIVGMHKRAVVVHAFERVEQPTAGKVW